LTSPCVRVNVRFPTACGQILVGSETNASMAGFEFKFWSVEEPFNATELDKMQAFVLLMWLFF